MRNTIPSYIIAISVFVFLFYGPNGSPSITESIIDYLIAKTKKIELEIKKESINEKIRQTKN